jgi:hypothetical protein
MNQDLLNLFFGSAVVAIGWFIKTLWNEHHDLDREVRDEFVRKDDYRNDILEIKDILKQIFDKLDKKADK